MASKTNGQLFRNARMHIDQSIYTHISQNSTCVMTKERHRGCLQGLRYYKTAKYMFFISKNYIPSS